MYTQTIEGYVKQPKYFWEFVQVRRSWANKNAEFFQLVAAISLSSEESFKFVQDALLINWTWCIWSLYPMTWAFNLLRKSGLWAGTKKANIRIFNYWLEKLSSVFKPYWWKFFSISIQKSSRFCNRGVAKSLSIFILSSCSVKVNLLCWLKLWLGSLKCWSACGTFCLLTFLQWLFNLMPSFVSDFPMYWIQ